MIKAGAPASVPAFATDVLSWCASVSEAAFSLSTDRVMLDELEMVIALARESHFGRAAEHLKTQTLEYVTAKAVLGDQAVEKAAGRAAGASIPSGGMTSSLPIEWEVECD